MGTFSQGALSSTSDLDSKEECRGADANRLDSDCLAA